MNNYLSFYSYKKRIEMQENRHREISDLSYKKQNKIKNIIFLL